MITQYLNSLPDHESEFNARCALFEDGWITENDEVLLCHDWITRNRDRLDVTKDGLLMPGGRRVKNRHVLEFVEAVRC